MKKSFLLKALVIIVPVLIAIFAQYSEQKKQKELATYCKAESNINNSINAGFYR